jgi:PilZ domain
MAEHRRATRNRTYKAGRIAFGGRRAVITCLIRDLSDSGACLGVESPIGIPDLFNLVFDSGEPSRMCQVVWRTATRVGVEFQ